MLVLGGRLAERFGSARVTVVGGVASAVVALPMFWLLDTRNATAVVLGVTLGVAMLSIPYAVSGDLLARLFPARLRYSGIALAANLAGIVSGFVPLVATAVLAAAGGGSWAPGLLLVGIALITVVSGMVAPRLYVPEGELSFAGRPAYCAQGGVSRDPSASSASRPGDVVTQTDAVVVPPSTRSSARAGTRTTSPAATVSAVAVEDHGQVAVEHQQHLLAARPVRRADLVRRDLEAPGAELGAAARRGDEGVEGRAVHVVADGVGGAENGHRDSSM